MWLCHNNSINSLKPYNPLCDSNCSSLTITEIRSNSLFLLLHESALKNRPVRQFFPAVQLSSKNRYGHSNDTVIEKKVDTNSQHRRH